MIVGAAVSAALLLCAPGMARSGMTFELWCLQPVRETEPGSDLGVEVPWRPR